MTSRIVQTRPKRVAKDFYTTGSYRVAIQRSMSQSQDSDMGTKSVETQYRNNDLLLGSILKQQRNFWDMPVSRQRSNTYVAPLPVGT